MRTHNRHSCRIKGCDRRIPNNGRELFCQTHWRKIPGELRAELEQLLGELEMYASGDGARTYWAKVNAAAALVEGAPA